MIFKYLFICAIIHAVIAGKPPPICSQDPGPRPPPPPESYSSASASASASSQSSRSSSSSHSSSSSYASSSTSLAAGCNDFDRCNNRNATYKKCPNPCPRTCGNPGGANKCNKKCQKFGCECYPGYVLSENGKCSLLKDCPDYLRCKGDRNAIFKERPNPCPRTCKFPGGSGPCSRMPLKEGCECKEDYYLSETGKCVDFQDCPGVKACSANETFVFCKAGCPSNYCPVDDRRAIVACSQPFPCGSGCSCKGNYLRLGRGDDRCILASECPRVRCTRPNEVWDGCPPPCLNERCSDIGKPNICDKRFYSCRPQCICRPGFYRNDSDICVPEKKCQPNIPTCGLNEELSSCKIVCPPQTCENSRRCKGDRNAIFKERPNPCPRTCKVPGESGPCNKMPLKEGCECKEDYYLSENGKCVQLQDCPGAKACSANETFVFCNVGCPSNYCPEDDSRAIVACDPPFPCGSGCSCNGNYLRLGRGDDRCILATECPRVRCTRPNEVWDGCPPPCLNERCSDIGKPIICDKRFYSCRPQCICKPGFYRNDKDICVPEKKCPRVRCTRPNEVWNGCPPPCLNERCSDIGKPNICDKRFSSCRPQCICRPGFYRNESDICVPEKKCQSLLCNGDRNAIFKEQPNPCPKTCKFPGGSGPCSKMALKEGCECKEDYYLSEDGKCVQFEDCPGAKACSANETFVFCNVGCPSNYCPVDDSRAIVACDPPFPCGSGCSCNGNYLRLGRGDDRCILASECPRVRCTRPNEVWDGCPPPCLNERCSDIGKPNICDKRFYPCRPQCICRAGFYRNESDICVPEKKCPPQCGYNEVPVKCKTICPPQVCENSYTEYACGDQVCEPGCDCRPNYLRNSSGICIPNEQCPPPTVPTCGLNEELSSCKIVCPPQSCESIYTLYLCSENITCESGCNCISGYLRDSNGVCVQSEQCPTNFPYTSYLCSTNITCELGCNCISGYLRDSNGVCVPSEQCPTNPLITCGLNEVATNCRIICPPQTCESIFSSYICENNTVCEPGCDCLSEHLRNSSGICVPSEKCFTADKGCHGDPNSIATSCPWPCPSTCDSPNAGTCGKKCANVGCQCKPGFILDKKNGKCILPNKCKSGNPCGVNGTFSECAFRCPNQNCPEDDSQLMIACKPGRPCPSGCLCKEYYKRISENDDTCVLASDCTPVDCTRPNEVWNPCASECLAENCLDVYQKTDCYADPNNCQPKCVCIDGYFRNITGGCVPKSECQQQCPVRIDCRPTCAVPNPPGCPFNKPSDTNLDGCNCQQGYIMSDVGGICIKIEECPPNIGCNGDPHARVKENPLPCPSTCDAPNATPCKRKSDPIGCECEPGYIKSEIAGKCILPDDCKGGNPCGPNSTFVSCRYGCPSFYCPTDDSRAILICETYPFAPCFSGCVCRLNHKILSRDNPICIRSDECPPVNCTRPYEKWNPCPNDCRSGYCEEVDKPPVTCNTLVLNCNPQCECKKSFYRNPETDICVSSKECRKINAKNNVPEY